MRHLAILFFGLLLTLFTVSTNAEDINLLQTQNKTIIVYENPDLKSKPIATVTAGQTIIPFFQQKDWVKIANPQNGLVGWIPKAELIQNTQTAVSISNTGVNQYVITQKGKNGSPGSSYSVIQYSNTKPMDQEQAEALLKKIQTQQQQQQEHFNKMIAEAFESMGIEKVVFDNKNLSATSIMRPIFILKDQTKSTPVKTENKKENK